MLDKNIAIKTDIIDIANEVVNLILTRSHYFSVPEISEEWICEQSLTFIILYEMYDKSPEKSNINNKQLVQEVQNEVVFIMQRLGIKFNTEPSKKNVYQNTNRDFQIKCMNLKEIVEKRKSELVKLEGENNTADCPPGWIQIKPPEEISTYELKFMKMQERIDNRRSGK